MIRKILLGSLIAFATFLSAQEIIRGTYSYTYGDNETLVQAKQTSKNLAIRDAIESYYVFVESTTKVENSQTKEDLIQSISTGIVQNLKITDQKEEGRTITTTVEGTVNPEQVKKLVDEKVAGMAASKDTVRISQPVASTTAVSEGDDIRFNATLSKYENRMAAIQQAWNAKQFDSAMRQIVDIQKSLEDSRPAVQSGFKALLYQSISTRNAMLLDLLKIEKMESQKKRFREKVSTRALLSHSEQLEKDIHTLEKMTDLSEKQKMVRKWWIGMCRLTLIRARSEFRQNRL